MAKKADPKTPEPQTPETKTPETVKGSKGTGWRYCEDCQYSTKGARSKACGKCGKAFPPPKAKAGKKAAKRKGKGKTAPAPSSDIFTSAIALVKAAGGFDRAKAILDQLEQVKEL
jgi:hypothetical protein